MVDRSSARALSLWFAITACVSGCAASPGAIEDDSANGSGADDTSAITPGDDDQALPELLAQSQRDGALARLPAVDAGVGGSDASSAAKRDVSAASKGDESVPLPSDPVLDAGAPTSMGDASTPAPAVDAAAMPKPIVDAASPSNDASSAVPPQDAAGPVGTTAKTLRTSGRRILDTCGEAWMARGVEQLVASAFSADGTLDGLARELIKTGSNAVRILPQNVSAAEIDALLSTFEAAKVVVFISPGDLAWFKRSDMKPVLLRHEKGLIIDAFQEPDYDDVPRWLNETKAAVQEIRAAGFSAPVTVLANQYGRDLTSALEHGQEIVAADPLHNTILGWQAYWGSTGYYQNHHGMTLAQGVERSAAMNFPMQIGIDLFADANEPMDYRSVMAAAQTHGIGWLWWNFWNQWDGLGNNASTDGRADHLTPAGEIFLHTDPNAVAHTAKSACFR